MKKFVSCVFLLSFLLLAIYQQRAELFDGGKSGNVSVLPAKVKEVKPGAQVNLASADVIVIEENKTSAIEILLHAQLGEGDMLVELNPGEGLQVSGITQPYKFTATEDGRYKLGLQVSALHSGRFYLNIKATINRDDTVSSRVLAVIVQVGDPLSGEDPVVAASATNKKLSSGEAKESPAEPVISLPAEEHISNQ